MTTSARPSEAATLSPLSRALTRALAAGYAALGLVLFLAPAWAAERFAWSVSAFVAMTIGAWCLGNGTMAWTAARVWRWSAVQAILGYVWSFGILQLGVLIWFREAARLDVALGWPYVAVIAGNALVAVLGVGDLLRSRPTRRDEGVPMPLWVRGLWILFVVLVGYLAFVGISRPEAGTTRNVFPEVLSPFTVRGFGAFYLALVLGVLPVIWSRTMAATRAFLVPGLILIAFILAAVVRFWGVFDVAAHPRQWLYSAAYAGSAVVGLLVLVWHRGRSSPA